METSRDEAENNNDSFKDLPAVNILSTSSASSTKSEPQPKKDVTTKRKNADGKNSDESTKKKEKLVTRNAQKEKLAQEKADRKRAQELNKVYKPGECSKHMKVIMHPELLGAWFTSDVEREVSQTGAKIVPTPDLCDPRLVMWKRCVPQKLVANDGQVTLSPSEETCGHGLYIITMEDVFTKILSRMLTTHVRYISEAANNIKLTLVIFGSRDYFKSSCKKSKENKHVMLSEVDLEMAITDLLVSTGSDTILINQASELAMLISQSTKAIAEAPFRRIRHKFDNQVDFYMRGDNKKCVAVDKDGNGLGNLWQQMISVLPLCSLETSRALCSNYKTPLALYETLTKEGAQAIANLGVTRSAAPGSRARRIGPEFAKKLHILFTAEDENALVE